VRVANQSNQNKKAKLLLKAVPKKHVVALKKPEPLSTSSHNHNSNDEEELMYVFIFLCCFLN
jgi:uncharacterized cupin superfamily protein